MADIRSEIIPGGRPGSGAHRVVALCGPYLSGKTSLLESLLYATGAIGRRGSTRAGTSIGDGAAEARKRGMGTEINVASVDYLGDQWTFLDVPGSIEFQHDAMAALAVCDAAVVVCEPSPERVVALAPLLKAIEDRHIPHIFFINKIDSAEARVRDMLAALQSVSSRKLVLRQVPIRQVAADGSEQAVGYVDLVSERAYRYRTSGASDLIEMPAEILPRESEARREMLETLSEFDDTLLEQLIEDVAPEKSLIYRDLHDEFGSDKIAPVLIGAGDRENGVRRLLKALRHDTPFVAETAARRGLETASGTGGAAAECFKVLHQSHAGKLSLCRVWSGRLVEGQSLGGQRLGTLLRPFGQRLDKVAEARAGEIVALAKVEPLSAGQVLSGGGLAASPAFPAVEPPVFALSLAARNRNDEVKLSGALHKIVEEDPSLSFEARGETHELLLRGQGEMHLRVAVDKLAGRYNVAVETGDCWIRMEPLDRGAGFQFANEVFGGSIPRNFIPAVEKGIVETATGGFLAGYPMVDFKVTVYDGSYHDVDSSEMAFKLAARKAFKAAMLQAKPALLEPVMRVEIQAPVEFAGDLMSDVTGRRGRMNGMDTKGGTQIIRAMIPMAEMLTYQNDLTAKTQGRGTFSMEFDHYDYVPAAQADKIVAAAKAAGVHAADDDE